MSVTMRFCGAAGTVTGSCYLIETPRARFLVDCGMFQGSKTVRELNYRPFPFNPRNIDAMLLTHAHIDHSGLIPKLTRQGFQGRVLTTEATRDLLTYMLPDSGYIQEMEVQQLNRRNARRGHAPVEPIYTQADAEAALERIEGVPFDGWMDFLPGVRVRFWNAGHILGAASIEIEVEGTRILFSGDLGPGAKALHPDPEAPKNLDYLVMESTYGGRERQELDEKQRRELLCKEVQDALKAGGNLVIAAFAIERTQELLYDLGVLFEEGRLPEVELFLDSPLAIRATEVFAKHADELGGPAVARMFERKNVHFVLTADESESLKRFTSGVILMAASGMCDAGRIRHHLKNNLWRSEATVFLMGYQAPGTLGHLLESGAPVVRIQGEEIQVRARIRMIDVYSGHADNSQLLNWAEQRLPVRQAAFLTHGEEESAKALRDGLVGLGCKATRVLIPQLDDTVELAREGLPRLKPDGKRLVAAALKGVDWHNDFSSLLLDVQHSLHDMADDESRRRLIKRLRRALEGTVAPSGSSTYISPRSGSAHSRRPSGKR